MLPAVLRDALEAARARATRRACARQRRVKGGAAAGAAAGGEDEADSDEDEDDEEFEIEHSDLVRPACTFAFTITLPCLACFCLIGHVALTCA